MNREDGFYWIKYIEHWEVAEFEEGYWWLTAVEINIKEVNILEINETRILPPNEKQ